MEKLIMTIIGAIFLVISYLIGLNQNRKEKEYYQREYQYYRNEYFHLKRENIKRGRILMENEIKVGDWVRTDNGIIGKYVKYRGIEDAIETDNKWIGFDIEKDIVKHSNNLIDIIEERRYINN